ncbi:hypothetical protein [Mobilicoccus massiliensis]|uniref:hypothetical protein n=1 Tax=Mobilicoccus massiliensis TaxID=1522310 RepID=UPI000A4151E3|nr:hypothetical protein [Mobilicoccus massiliensis]
MREEAHAATEPALHPGEPSLHPAEVTAPSVREASGASVATRVGQQVRQQWYQRPRAFVVGVLAIYFVARLVSAVMLVIVGTWQQDVTWNVAEHGQPYNRMTVLWDAFWYRQIVEDGYPSVMPKDTETGRLWQSPWAFYPLFPYLTRFLMQITGGSFAVVGATLSLLVGAAAAVLIAILLRDRVGPRVAVAGVTLWATFMAAPVLQVAYTESIATLMLCGVLYYLTRERWLAAGAVAFLTGLARPIALPLGFVGVVCVFMRWRRRRERPVTVAEWVKMFAALVACGLSGLIWPVFAWLGTGVPTAYTDTMAAWRAVPEIQPFEPWWNLFRWMAAYRFDAGPAVAALGLVAVVLLTFGLVLGPWARALGPELRAWSFGYALYLFASLDPSTSIFRYMLMQFPIAVVLLGQGFGAPRPIPGVDPPQEPGGATVAERHSPRLWWILAAGVVINLALQWWWIDVIWHFTPPADTPP